MCSKSCGGGKQTRLRRVATRAAHGGRACTAHLTEIADCNTAACPMDACKVTQWGAWTTCSVTCGGGEHSRTRAFVNPAEVDENGMHRKHGVKCPVLAERKPCMAFTCPLATYQSALAAAKATSRSPKLTDTTTGAKFDSNGRLQDHNKVAYFPKLSTSCCRAKCGGRVDCELGCTLWLHSSSLNWASASWHPQLLSRCERDCGSSQAHQDLEQGQHRLPTDPSYGIRQHETKSYWSKNAGKLTPSSLATCQHGCKYYFMCLGVTPVEKTDM